MTPDEVTAHDLAEIATVRAMIAPAGQVAEFPPNLIKARAGHDAMAGLFPIVSGSVITPTHLGGIAAERIAPPHMRHAKVILFLHGWGFSLGSMKSHRHLVAQISAASGALSFMIDFRLSPEAPCPAAINDIVTAYCAILALGHKADDIVIGGDSSGAGLALSAALTLRDQGLPQPAGLFLASPWVDLRLIGESLTTNAKSDFMCNQAELAYWAELYAGDLGLDHPIVSPLLGDLTGLAPMLIHAGSHEILLSDATRLAQQARLADVEVDLMVGANMPHGWHYMWPFLSAARNAITQAGHWIEGVTKAHTD
jgi:epsilon-lactone hydrolase